MQALAGTCKPLWFFRGRDRSGCRPLAEEMLSLLQAPGGQSRQVQRVEAPNGQESVEERQETVGSEDPEKGDRRARRKGV